jgi:hypothetical protein
MYISAIYTHAMANHERTPAVPPVPGDASPGHRYTLADAARRCGLAPVSLRQAAQRGRLQTTRVGEGRRSTLYVTEADLNAYLTSRRRGRHRSE